MPAAPCPAHYGVCRNGPFFQATLKTMCASILVIENDVLTMELMLYLLKSFGFQPIIAFDGAAGLELASIAKPVDPGTLQAQLRAMPARGVASISSP